VGIAINMKLSPAITAEAVISGAYFGDKSSPLSDTANLAGALVTADQYIAIVLPGRMLKGAFEQRRHAPVVLSRALGDSATVTSALIPWNSCGAFMAAALGVATLSYAPFTFFNLLNPLISILFGFAGIRMLKQQPGMSVSS
jgi:Na+:H+ antiporter, NhaC family